ncbi:DUF2946 family protein [Achromobacter marplatensis]|uniref:DUF2946 family protein n=1 Tax=Achromobacter marplatensis TaxID=470868 RepID=UPI0039F73FE2
MRTGLSRRPPRTALAVDVGRLLLLLLLVARAWVPVGYMPDADALRQGRLALEFCVMGGGVWPGLRAPLTQPAAQPHAQSHAQSDAHHGNHGDPGHGGPDGHGAAGQECPFGLSAHQVLDVPPMMAVAPVLLRWLARTPLRVDSPRPAMPAAGPPLGSRAPPSIPE